MHVLSFAPYGADGIVVRVEVDIRRGIPGVDVTGLAEGAVRESRERVRAAFRNSGFRFPEDRVLVNLAPAGVRKEGASLDLPIALAVLSASGLVSVPAELMALGELELSGRIRPVRGVLAAAAAGLAVGVDRFVVPSENGREASILAGDRVAAVGTLSEAVESLRVLAASGRFPSRPSDAVCPSAPSAASGVDFADAAGQERCKRALEIAAAGGHNLLLFGPPGVGKTLLSRRLPSIMAPLTREESVAVTRIHSLAGILGADSPLVSAPPFRAPHHSASAEGILGGGRSIRPGEISLAHCGVLFLDESPEFRADVLRALREPTEEGAVTIARAEGNVRLPADFQLLLAANPCPCGRLGRDSGSCFCSSDEVTRHWRRLGAALLDRVEIRVPMRADGAGPMRGAPPESSAAVAARVRAAVSVQEERYRGLGIRRNGRLPPGAIERFCPLDGDSLKAFRSASEHLDFSARACHAILRVARTIADLDLCGLIRRDHVLEAVQHRRRGDDPYDILLKEF